MKTIEIVIEPTGDLQIDAVGFSGADCEKATAFLEEALGKMERRRQKPERHRKVQQRIGA